MLPVDYVFAGFGILLTLEAARRAVGMPMVIIASSFLVYAYFGAYFPGFLAHRGYSLQRIASHMYFTTEGILGIPLGVSASFIYLFILFGAFSERSGLGQLFIDISNAIAGWASGGPAKVAVVTSAFEGMVSGSSVANTVQSGAFTIPMMKRLGYSPEFAAAVEASASTGGQIMPPLWVPPRSSWPSLSTFLISILPRLRLSQPASIFLGSLSKCTMKPSDASCGG